MQSSKETALVELFFFLNSITPISPSTWDQASALFSERKLAKHEYFSQVGNTASKIAFLRNGVVRSFYANGKGDVYNKNFFVGPALIGAYTSLITQRPNQLAQQALTPCEILEADYKKIRLMYDTCPDLERLARIQAEMYFVEKETREVNLVMLQATDRYRIFQQQYPTLEQLIPQHHIASFLGIKPVQLSRIRAKKE